MGKIERSVMINRGSGAEQRVFQTMKFTQELNHRCYSWALHGRDLPTNFNESSSLDNYMFL